MNIWNVAFLAINLILLLVVSWRIKDLQLINSSNQQIRNNIQVLVKENAQITNLILDELEGKITEARGLLQQLEENPLFLVDRHNTPAPISDNTKVSEVPAAESLSQAVKPMDSRIVYMRQMGMSNQEIAEKLKVSQGEIDLKINLQEKLAANITSKINKKTPT